MIDEKVVQFEPVEPREGIATVYGPDGTYLGCIGIERWRVIVADEKTASYRDALKRIAEQQQTTLKWLEEAGIVFDEKPRPAVPGDWQQIAFWVYTDLCQVDVIARTALDA